jgi:serine/threonine protein kinase
MDDNLDPLDELMQAYLELQRNGTAPSVEDFAQQYPDWADDLRELLPMVSAMESAKTKVMDKVIPFFETGTLERLGEYRLLREIGRGGMGIVYAAEQESLERTVAVKVLPRQSLANQVQVQRFHREARTAAGLHHPHIVSVYGVGEQDDYHYYVMELIDGVSLDRVIHSLNELKPASEGTLATVCNEVLSAGARDPEFWRAVASVGIQAGEALQYAHSMGVMHRDIKPANLLINETGQIWIADFGLAKALHDSDLTRSEGLSGTLRYMAPEQFSGNVDFRSDEYSLGLTLYELCAGRPAHSQADRGGLIRQITETDPPAPGSFCGGMPRDLEIIVGKAIARDPLQRYASAGDLVEDLRRFLEDRPILARPLTPMGRFLRWRRRNPALAGFAATTFLLAVSLAIVGVTGYFRTRLALKQEARQRQRAQANADLVVEALDNIFDGLAPGAGPRFAELPTGSDVETTKHEATRPVLSHEAAVLLQQLLPLYDRLAAQSEGEADIWDKLAEANRRLGEVQHYLGDDQEAETALRKAVDLYKKHAGTLGATRRLEYVRTLNILGWVLQATQRSAKAREIHLTALSILKGLAETASPSTEVLYEQARTFYFLGARVRPQLAGAAPPPRKNGPLGGGPPVQWPRRKAEQMRTAVDEGKAEADKNYLDQAVQILEQLLKQNSQSPEYRYLLALCLRNERPGETSGLARATEILEQLAQDYPEVPEYRYELCESYSLVNFHELSWAPGNDAKMKARLSQAQKLADELVAAHPNVVAYTAILGRVYHRLAGLARQDGGIRDAVEHLNKAVELARTLVAAHPESTLYQAWLGTYLNDLGASLLDDNQFEKGLTVLDESVAVLDRLLMIESDKAFVHSLLARTWATKGRLSRQQGRRALFKQAREQVAKHRKLAAAEADLPVSETSEGTPKQ